MGDGEVSNTFRERLERNIDDLQAALKQANEKNKPVQQMNPNGLPVGALGGAALGGAIFGPVGALVGGLLGGLFEDEMKKN